MIGRTISHYRILSRVGGGQMGDVYRARDLRLRNDVALKFLPRAWNEDPDARRRFVREARAAASLQNDHICTVHEIDETDDGQLFLAMTLYEGGTLKQRLAAGRMDPEDVRRIALEIADGLEAAHAAGIAHRDIKPANIMIPEHGAAKILDFGIAKFSGATQHTRSDVSPGTPAYMSPEQASGDPVDTRTDIWSLGVVLWEMTTGSHPFAADYEQAVIYSILHEPPHLAPGTLAGPARDLISVASRCLAKDPDERYASIAQVSAALRGEAAPDKRRTTTGRTVMLASAVAALLLIALAFVVTTRWSPPLPDLRRVTIAPVVVKGDSEREFWDRWAGRLDARLRRLELHDPSLQILDARASGGDALLPGPQPNLRIRTTPERGDRTTRLRLEIVEPDSDRVVRRAVVDSPVTDADELSGIAAIRIANMLDVDLRPEVTFALTDGLTQDPRAFAAYVEARGRIERYPGPANLREAVALLGEAIEADPSFASAHAALADAYLKMFQETSEMVDLDRVREHAVRALRLDPDLPGPRVSLGIVLRETGAYEEATEEIARALERDPDDAVTHRELALTLALAGDAAGAEPHYLRAAEIDPLVWSNWSHLGVFYLQRGRFAEAETAFHHIPDLEPSNPRGYSLLGSTLALSGRFEDAVKMFREAIRREPSSDDYSNLGAALCYLERYDEAARAFRSAIDLQADRDRVHYRTWANLGDALRYAGGPRDQIDAAYRRALTALDEQRRTNPRDGVLCSDAAQYRALLGDCDLSRSDLRAALASTPTDVEVLMSAVIVHEMCGERDEALTSVTYALDHGVSAERIAAHPDLRELNRDPRFATTEARSR